MWRVSTWDIFDLWDKKRTRCRQRAARLRVSPKCLLLLVNGFSLHPVLIQQALPSYLYPPNAKTCPHFVQTIVCPIWLHSQRLSTTCTITNTKKNVPLTAPIGSHPVCFIPLPLVGAHAPASPTSPSPSKAKAHQDPGSTGSPGSRPRLQHCSSLDNNYSVFVSVVPACQCGPAANSRALITAPAWTWH